MNYTNPENLYKCFIRYYKRHIGEWQNPKQERIFIHIEQAFTKYEDTDIFILLAPFLP